MYLFGQNFLYEQRKQMCHCHLPQIKCSLMSLMAMWGLDATKVMLLIKGNFSLLETCKICKTTSFCSISLWKGKTETQNTWFYYNIQMFWKEINESEVIHTTDANRRFFGILGESLDELVCTYIYTIESLCLREWRTLIQRI